MKVYGVYLSSWDGGYLYDDTLYRTLYDACAALCDAVKKEQEKLEETRRYWIEKDGEVDRMYKPDWKKKNKKQWNHSGTSEWLTIVEHKLKS